MPTRKKTHTRPAYAIEPQSHIVVKGKTWYVVWAGVTDNKVSVTAINGGRGGGFYFEPNQQVEVAPAT